ncbi:hypothetical protein [Synechocystis salina]|nr:hypothetical protein [Synechocystis salina]
MVTRPDSWRSLIADQAKSTPRKGECNSLIIQLVLHQGINH